MSARRGFGLRGPARGCLLLVPVSAAAAFAFAGCGSGDGGSASTTVTRQAASGVYRPVSCPNVRSTSATLVVENRTGQDLRVMTPGVDCTFWSQTGNPTTFNSQVVGSNGAYRRLEPANGTEPRFLVYLFPGSGGTAIGSFMVKLRMSGGKPSQTLGRNFPENPWVTNGTFLLPPSRQINGQRIRIVTGIARIPNGGQAADGNPDDIRNWDPGWSLRIQLAK